MLLLFFYLLLILSAFSSGEDLESAPVVPFTDSRCNCDVRCPQNKVIGLRKSGERSAERLTQSLDEDGDEDGDPVICARDVEATEHTFPSLCHMICHNRCGRFQVRKIILDEKEVAHVVAYRDNFYKLHEGTC